MITRRSLLASGAALAAGCAHAVNDIGIVWPPDGAPIVLIAYTNARGSEIAAGEAAIARAAGLALRALRLL